MHYELPCSKVELFFVANFLYRILLLDAGGFQENHSYFGRGWPLGF